MKFHNNIFGWEYSWQEFANDQKGTPAVDPEATPSLLRIEIPVDSLGDVKFVPVHPGAKNSSFYATCPLDADSDFLFNIHDESLLGNVAKLIGMQDIQVCDSELDKKFVIQSNRPELIKRLLANASLKELLLQKQHIVLQALKGGDKIANVGPVPSGTKVLHFSQTPMPTRYEELEEIFHLVTLAAKLTNTVLAQPEETYTSSRTVIPASLLNR